MVKKKPHEEHHEEHADESWLVPYADILTLLLALFIVLFASSTVDKEKVAAMATSFADAFSSYSAEQTTGSIGTFVDAAKNLALDDRMGIGTDARGATIDITSIELFEEGSGTLKEEAMPLLRQIGTLLRSDKYKKFKVIIEGHTDDIDSSSGLYPSNWELSAVRAGAVVNALIKMGLDRNRFRAVGMAGISPAYPNFDRYGEPIPGNREKNRRVMIRVEP